MGHVGSNTRSLGQFLEKPFVHTRRHSLEPKFANLCQSVYLDKIKARIENRSCCIKN